MAAANAQRLTLQKLHLDYLGSLCESRCCRWNILGWSHIVDWQSAGVNDCPFDSLDFPDQRLYGGGKESTMSRLVATILTAAALVLLIHAQVPIGDKIDFEKAKQIRQKMLQGQKLTEEERGYLEKAIQAKKGLRSYRHRRQRD